jgi:signal transduction histidine kinase/ligand-binding sensor domain-containing protein
VTIFKPGLSNVKRLVIAHAVTATLLLSSLSVPNAFGGEASYPDFIAPDSPAAFSGHPPNDLRFEHLTNEQGLSNNRVLAVIRDSMGFMWFGTLDGLNRYDGYEFRVFRHDLEDEHSLSADFVMALYQDRDDFLWVGTSGGGLNRYDPATEQFEHYRHDPADPNTLSSDNVAALYQDREGILWIGTDGGGLNRYDAITATFTRYTNNPDDPYSLSHNVVWAIHEDEQGVLWVGTDGGGLNRFDRETGHFIAHRHDPGNPDSLGGDSVLAIEQGQDGSLWLGTRSSGLDRFDLETERFVHYQFDPNEPFSLSNDSVWDLYADPLGIVWIGTSGGGLNRLEVQPIDGQVARFVRYEPSPNEPNSLNHNQVRKMYADPSGLLWLATVGGGVNLVDFERKPFTNYQSRVGDPNSLSSNDILEVYEDHEGILWIGTGGGGLSRLDRKTLQFNHYVRVANDPHSLSDNHVRTIIEDGDGLLWMATRAGLNRFDPQTEQFTVYRAIPNDSTGLLNDSIWGIYLDASGLMWVGTSAALNRFNPLTGQFQAFKNDPDDPSSISGNTVVVIHEDGTGILWFGTRGDGLNSFDPETERFTQYRHDPENPQSLGGNTVWSIHEDPKGVLWIGTSAGLDRLDPDEGQFRHYGKGDGLPGGSVMSILDDSGQTGSNLWLSTSSGLIKFDPERGTLRRYDAADGLQGNEFNWDSAFKSISGELFFGGTNGLTAFYPEQIQDSSHVPPVILTGLQLANKPVEIGGESILSKSIGVTEYLTLSHEERVISFEFAALGYRAQEKSRYRYMMEGFDEDWTEVGADRRFVTYTNLDPGDYVFRVSGSNGDGVWNEQDTSIEISVNPPWWQTPWALGFTLILVIAGLFGVYRWRVNSLESRSQELEIMVTEKTRQLDDRVSELSTLLSVSQNVTSTLDLDALLSLILDELRKVVDYDVGTIRRLVRGKMELQSYRWLSPKAGLPSQHLPVANIPIIREMVQSQQAILVDDHQFNSRIVGDSEQFDTRLTGDVLQASRTLMAVPLVVKDETIGMLVLGHHQPNHWVEETKELVQAVANQAAVAITNAELFEKVEESATLEERTRLARELHDSATQSLYSATLFSEAGKELAEQGDVESAGYYLSRVGEVVQQALKDLRLLIFQLRPPVLEEEGLVGAIQKRLDAVEKRAGMEVRLIGDPLLSLPGEAREELYAITLEALNNVLKHAETDNVTVSIRSDGHIFTLEVADDGKGFDLDNARDGGGMGLGNMQERTTRLGGDLTIESALDQGTRVKVTVPMEVSE